MMSRSKKFKSSEKLSSFQNSRIDMTFWTQSLIFCYLVFVFFGEFSCSVNGYQPHVQGVSSWNTFPQFHTMKKVSDPKFLMADVVNNLGLKLLAVGIRN